MWGKCEMPVKSNLVILDDKLIARNLLHFVYKKKKILFNEDRKKRKKRKNGWVLFKAKQKQLYFPASMENRLKHNFSEGKSNYDFFCFSFPLRILNVIKKIKENVTEVVE